MKRLFYVISLFFFIALQALKIIAQPSYGELPPIHVDGRFFVDEAGNKVVLHGAMDTPNAYFNANRWTEGLGWPIYSNDAAPKKCIDYFDKVFEGITNRDKGAYCTLFRLHLDPAWTNDGTIKSPKFPVDTEMDEKPGGEADISQYNGARLTKFLRVLYWPIAQKALNHGMYVIMRPPGVCPKKIQDGKYYQKYLLDVWDRVTKNVNVLKYYGHISLELANEPRFCIDKNGDDNDKALHDFFQPIVDKIRENGFKGIILIPGTGYQSNYRPYAKYPITDPLNNIGFAVHNYSGWYDCSDSNCNPSDAIKNFQKQVPIITTNPIVITEVDWSPLKEPKEVDHMNEFNQPVYKNWGTWATGSTSKWGKAYKAILDNFKNVSMTLTSIDAYMKIDDYLKDKTVTPAFSQYSNAEEGSGVACFEWYKNYSEVNYPSFERYQNIEYPEDPFERSKDWFDPLILNRIYDSGGDNSASHKSSFSELTLKKGGYAGWRFDNVEGIDLSKHQTLKIIFANTPKQNTFVRIYDNSCNMNFVGRFYKLQVNGAKEFTIDLHNMEAFDYATKSVVEGVRIDPTHIRMVCIGTEGSDQTIFLKSVTLEGEVADGISTMKEAVKPVAYYSSNGIKQNGQQKGLNIVKYNDGSWKKIYVK